MMRDHPDDETLAVYVTDPDVLPNREEIEEHLRSCEQCGVVVAAARQMEAEFDHPDSWASQSLAELPTVPEDRVIRTMQRYSVEDATAAFLLDPLISDPQAFRDAKIGQESRFFTFGAVRRLVGASAEARESNPNYALELADAAVMLAEQLPVMWYSRDEIEAARGAAWRERANALRYTGAYPAALAAVDLAEAAFHKTNLPFFDLARIAFVRGTILWKLWRYDEALPLAESSRQTFIEYGDEERQIHAGLLEGGIHFDTKRYDAALRVFEALVAPAERLNLGPTLGLVYNGLAATLMEFSELPRASELFRKTLALYEHYGMVIERTRTEWSLALLAIRQGHRAAGVRRLREALATFEDRGSVSDAGLVALDLAEVLLEDGDRVAVLQLCDELATRFARAGMETSAAAAMRFFHAAAVQGEVRPATFQHVRRYFRRLEEQPALVFAPPPDDARRH